jgi:hypothetical protein
VRRYERVRFRGRERYGYEILDDALKHSVARYGPYKVEPVTTEMSIARLRQQVLKGDLINVVVFPVGLKEIDEGLIPIDIPLDKGLHGYRIAFIRATDQDRMCRVRDIAGLRQLRIGTGEQWAEAPNLSIQWHSSINCEKFRVVAADAGKWTVRLVPTRHSTTCFRVR